MINWDGGKGFSDWMEWDDFDEEGGGGFGGLNDVSDDECDWFDWVEFFVWDDDCDCDFERDWGFSVCVLEIEFDTVWFLIDKLWWEHDNHWNHWLFQKKTWK